MTLGQIVLLVYAILMIAGGMAGARAGSKVSMIAGSASGLALLLALLWSSWNPVAGFWAGAAIGLVLCGVFGSRLAKTGKMMPSGLLLLLSLVALLLLAYAAGSAGTTAEEPAIDSMPARAMVAGTRARA